MNETKTKETPLLDHATTVVVLYVIEKLNGVLGKTHLQKMLFLIDLLSVKKFKDPVTKLEFQKNHYGPYSQQVDTYITHLVKKDLINIKEFPFSDNGLKSYTRFYFVPKTTVKKQLFDTIGAEKTMLIEDIITSYGNVSLQAILDVVYKIEEVKNSDLHTPLEMAKIITNDKNEIEELDIF